MVKQSTGEAPTARDVGFKRPKIRESCTHCSSQKIRCTKERPACARCVNKGLLCQYNISRRTGTRRHSFRVTPEPENMLEPAVFAAPTSNAANTATIDTSTLETFSMLDEIGSFDDLLWQPTGGANTDELDMQYLACFDVDNDHSSKAVDSVHATPLTTQEMAEIFGIPATESSALEPDLNGPPSFSITPPSLQDDGDRQFGHTGGGCISTALQIFSELHVSSPSCPVALGTGVEEAREFDFVLDNNRMAIERLSNILDCRSCCQDHEVLTAAYLAIQKALSWYSAALDTVPDGDPAHRTTRVTSPPAFLGSYALGIQAQTLARAYVVLSQLEEHFQPLMDKLQLNSSAPILGPRSSSTTSLNSVASSHSSSTGSAIVECHQRALQGALNDVLAKIEAIKRG